MKGTKNERLSCVRVIVLGKNQQARYDICSISVFRIPIKGLIFSGLFRDTIHRTRSPSMSYYIACLQAAIANIQDLLLHCPTVNLRPRRRFAREGPGDQVS